MGDGPPRRGRAVAGSSATNRRRRRYVFGRRTRSQRWPTTGDRHQGQRLTRALFHSTPPRSPPRADDAVSTTARKWCPFPCPRKGFGQCFRGVCRRRVPTVVSGSQKRSLLDRSMMFDPRAFSSQPNDHRVDRPPTEVEQEPFGRRCLIQSRSSSQRKMIPNRLVSTIVSGTVMTVVIAATFTFFFSSARRAIVCARDSIRMRCPGPSTVSRRRT